VEITIFISDFNFGFNSYDAGNLEIQEQMRPYAVELYYFQAPGDAKIISHSTKGYSWIVW